jgi:hypothetical protein
LPTFIQRSIHFFGEGTEVWAFNNFVLLNFHLPIIEKRMALVEEDLLPAERPFAPPASAPSLRNFTHELPNPTPQTQSAFHPHAQRNAFRRRDVRPQSKSFARRDQSLRRSPNSNRLRSDCQRSNPYVALQNPTDAQWSRNGKVTILENEKVKIT